MIFFLQKLFYSFYLLWKIWVWFFFSSFLPFLVLCVTYTFMKKMNKNKNNTIKINSSACLRISLLGFCFFALSHAVLRKKSWKKKEAETFLRHWITTIYKLVVVLKIWLLFRCLSVYICMHIYLYFVFFLILIFFFVCFCLVLYEIVWIRMVAGQVSGEMCKQQS